MPRNHPIVPSAVATGVRRLAVALLLLAPAFGENGTCIDCHSDPDKLEKALKGKKRPLASLLVDAKRFAASVHGNQSCAECHFDYDDFPHPDDAETPACGECHEDAATAYGASVHAQKGENRPVACGACHGVHDVFKPAHRQSTLHPLNVDTTCGKCHFDVDPATATVEEILSQRYTDDSHAQGLLRAGLTVSATCVSCHGGHDIHARGDPESPLARIRVHETCGACHIGLLEKFKESVHFEKVENGERQGATCTDCHPPHSADIGPDFRLQSVARCGHCHAQRMGTFKSTYHGKITSLGFGGGRVADCAACHGSHDIRSKSDPASRIHPNRLVETCATCHKKSNREFASFMVHADPKDREASPGLNAVYRAMVWLLAGTFILGGLHAALWLVRSLVAKEWRHRVPPGPKRYVRRWSRFYVTLHVVFMTAFLLLAGTGFPLHYSDRPWAHRLMEAFGGPEVAGWTHRLAATVMIGCIVAYLGHIARRMLKGERGLWTGPNTMVPRYQDVKDLAANVRWFLGLGPKPTFDRWTYWEKFDFWAVFWGVVIIGGSGVLLWFPETATRILPGWMLNVATIVHGHEALLAVGFIFSIHIFHANLRPDKFPMDTLFFTGRIPEYEFRMERGREFQRTQAEGQYDSLLVDAPSHRRKRTGYLVGGIALVAGLTFLALMIAAAVS